MRYKLLLLLMTGIAVLSVEPADARDTTPRYLLRPGDTLHVTYRVTPEYDATVQVQPDGYVGLPLVGDLNVGGKALPEVRAEIEKRAATYLKDPELQVDLKDFEQPFYVVGGEVGSPGRFPLHGRITALRAIATAGGFKVSSKASQVLLVRPVNGVDGKTQLLDLTKKIDGHNLAEDMELQPGDMLFVPKNRIAKIEPFVRLVNWGFYLNPLSL
jgi:polysaccharide export outer membrane protein